MYTLLTCNCLICTLSLISCVLYPLDLPLPSYISCSSKTSWVPSLNYDSVHLLFTFVWARYNKYSGPHKCLHKYSDLYDYFCVLWRFDNWQHIFTCVGSYGGCLLGWTNFENIEPRAPHWRIFISVYKSLFLSLMVVETFSRTLLTNSTINLEICKSLETTFPSLR